MERRINGGVVMAEGLFGGSPGDDANKLIAAQWCR
jgi:hypothetical protein